MDFQDAIKKIKESLKTKSRFKEGLDELAELIPTHLNAANKRAFYDALTIIAFRVGKPGFNAEWAQPVFQLALDHKQAFTPGFRRKIEEWKENIDKIVSNPGSFVPMTPGQKTASAHSHARPRGFPQGLDPLEVLLLRSMLNRGESSSDDDYDSEGEYQRYRSTLPFNRGLNYRDDDSSDDDLFPTRPSGPPFLPFMMPNLSSHSSPSSSQSSSQATAATYPYSKFVDNVLIPPTRFKHVQGSVTHNLNFTLSPALNKQIQENPLLQVSLCCYNNHNYNECSTFPNGVDYQINGKPVNVTESDTTRHGFNVTSMCKEGANVLAIEVNSCCCGFAFGVRMMENRSIETLMEQVKTRPKETYEEGQQRVKNSFKSDSDIMALSLQVSLKDPLSQMRISVPVKGKKCGHIQCFDLEPFLRMNRRRPKFECPLCYKQALFEDLTVDTWMTKLLEQIKDSEVEEVEIRSDGGWQIPNPEEKKKRKSNWGNELAPENKRIEPKKQKQLDVIDLT